MLDAGRQQCVFVRADGDWVPRGSGEVSWDHSSSAKSFDWKSIEIYIINEDNKIEEKSQPSDNGFYLIPIPQKKNYKLVIRSTKKDLKFVPEFYAVDLQTVSEEDAQLTYNSESFNFKLSGFTLHQSVRFLGESLSSSFSHESKLGIGIELYRENTLVGETKTDKEGDFRFEDISPGAYVVRVSKESLAKSQFKSSEVKCQYSWEKGSECSGAILLVGSRLTIRVTLSGEEVKRGTVMIKSKEGVDMSGCSGKNQKAKAEKGFDCAAPVVDSVASFSEVPFGKFTVMLQFDNKYILVDPKELEIEHLGGAEAVLAYSGFSEGQQGRVVTPKGNGIKGVGIKIDGEQKYVTNEQGYFNLEKLKIGTYDFEAVHQHYAFKPFSLKIDGDSEKVLEKITADLIVMCGKVDFQQKGSETISGYSVNVQLENVDGRDKRNTKIKQDGTYCYEVPAGTYTVKTTITLQDKVLSVVPKQRVVTLDDQPVLNVDFSREKLSIKGSVEYLQGVPASFQAKTEILMYNSEQQLVKSYPLNGELKFEFKDLFEEGYFIRVSNPLLCFEKDTLGENDYSAGAKFINKGILASYRTQVPFTAVINKSEKVAFSPKNTNICLSKVGKLSFEVEDTFTFKGSMNKFEYDTLSDKPKEMVFEVESVRLTGTFVVDVEKASGFEALVDRIGQPSGVKIVAKGAKGEEEVATIEKVQGKEGVYRYVFKSRLNNVITVRPVFGEKELDERFVLSPKKIEFSVGNLEDVRTTIEPFTASLGTIIQGSLTNALKNVRVRIMRKGEGDEVYSRFRTVNLTGTDFKVGPLRRDAEYSVEVFKRGFDFEISTEKDRRGDYKSVVTVIEISQIIVKIQTDKKEPLSNVAVYITSTERGNYFKTSVLTGERGSFRKNIQKGEYFIKSILKEYQFDPSQTVVRIEEGQKKVISIKAKRTQFSAYGSGRSCVTLSEEVRRPGCSGAESGGDVRGQGQPVGGVEHYGQLRELRDKGVDPWEDLPSESRREEHDDNDA